MNMLQIQLRKPEGLNKSKKGQQQEAHKRTKKYERQKFRTSMNKDAARKAYLLANPNDKQNAKILGAMGYTKSETKREYVKVGV